MMWVGGWVGPPGLARALTPPPPLACLSNSLAMSWSKQVILTSCFQVGGTEC